MQFLSAENMVVARNALTSELFLSLDGSFRSTTDLGDTTPQELLLVLQV